MDDLVSAVTTTAAPFLGEGVGSVFNWADVADGDAPPEAFASSDLTASNTSRALSPLLPAGSDSFSGGLTWHVELVLPPVDVESTKDSRTFAADGSIKPCRPLPTMFAADFFGALRQNPDTGRWELPGQPNGINGWLALDYPMELLSITQSKSSVPKSAQKSSMSNQFMGAMGSLSSTLSSGLASASGSSTSSSSVKRCWTPQSDAPPEFPSSFPGATSCRVTLAAPGWTSRGFYPDSLGMVFWATTHLWGDEDDDNDGNTNNTGRQKGDASGSVAASDQGNHATFGLSSDLLARTFPALAGLGPGEVARVLCGRTHLHAALQKGTMYPRAKGGPVNPEMTQATIFTHRYAARVESAKDRMTYHAFVFLEWDHGHFGSIVELAWKGGVGGYKGKTNWHADKVSPGPTSFCRAMPAAMVAPWDLHRSEVRIYDVPMSNKAQMMAFLERYTGKDERFFSPVDTGDGGPVALQWRRASDLVDYLCNYVGNDPSYTQESRNCQTFAADLCGFLTGNHRIEPFKMVNRILYKPKHYHFFLDPAKKPAKKTKKKKTSTNKEAAGMGSSNHSTASEVSDGSSEATGESAGADAV